MSSKKKIGKNDLIFAYRVPFGESFHSDIKNVAKMAKAGIDTVCFFAGNTYSRVGVPYSPYPLIWCNDHKYDFTVLDRQVADLEKFNPKIKLICFVDLNSPLWLARLLRRDSYDELGNCAANPEWRKLTFAYLKNFLVYAEKNHKARIIAYVLACGKTTEWFDMRPEGDDFREEAFFRWCRNRKTSIPAHIPSRQRRLKGSHSFIRDPKNDAEAIAYWRFSNELISSLASDMITESRKHVREDVQIGMFMSAGLESVNPIEVGQAGYQKVFDTPGINFSIAAGNSFERLRTEGHGFIVPQLTLKLRNMHHLVETDQRTHTSNRKISKFVELPDSGVWRGWKNEALTIAGLKREMALCMINHASIWFFNIFGSAYQGARVWDTFALIKKVWDDNIRLETKERAEILLVVDPESTYYIGHEEVVAAEVSNYAGYNDGQRQRRLFKGVRQALNLIGAPYQSCCFDDLDKIGSLSRYKFIIFANLFAATAERLAFLKKKVFKDGRTVLWQHAPGIIGDNGFKANNVKALSGCPFGKNGLQIKKYAEWTSAYLFDSESITASMLRKLAEDAAVHIYVPQSVGLQANSCFLMIHNDEPKGKIPVKLPRCARQVKELFSGRLAAENTAAWKEDFSFPDTRLFHIKWL